MNDRIGKKAEIALGKAIAELRMAKGMKHMELGKIINATQRQMVLYEKGDFIPLARLEQIGEALGAPIDKRTIRRISILRKMEKDNKEQQDELETLYQQMFAGDIDDDE